MMQRIDENFETGRIIATRAYLMDIRRRIGKIYILFSTLVPASFILSIILSYHFSGALHYYLKNASSIIIVYAVYIAITYTILRKTRRIQYAAIRMEYEVRGKNRGSFFRIATNGPTFFLILFISPLILYIYLTIFRLYSYYIFMDAVFIAAIILWFYRTFKLFEDVPPWWIWDWIAIAGFITGFLLGEFVFPYLYFIFSVTWLVAGIGTFIDLKKIGESAS
ncbi:hypothetical protein DMB44_08200 [Thermoplasma sp. Kam2015]|uniref:hypothetical protein n=1 Tax=Thermoplasma sp. Kam2015 TaxID=2094122 RepID=UPI000D874F75|nr:hypothetical protein [Thermoplasma sp. Kam2015]PYB67647.1 hypothetical protein DMB44_08200 [Thermoplasma sp. Kam2015]